MRGDKAQANAEAQRNLMNRYAGQYNQQGRQIFAMERPTLEQMLSGQGYTPEQRAAITKATLGGVRSVFDAAAQNAANQVASTRNDAGFLDFADQLARDQGREAAQAAAQNQLTFANDAQQRQQQALQDLSQIYGIDVNAMDNLLRGAGQVAGSEVEAANRPSFFDALAGSVLGGAARAVTPRILGG